MTSTLFIVQIVLAILITGAVLLQKSSSIGLGAYSGSNESLFGAKGPAGFLAKLTFALALLFVINTLALGYLYSKANNKSAVDTVKQGKNPAAIPAVPFKIEKNTTTPLKTAAEKNTTAAKSEANATQKVAAEANKTVPAEADKTAASENAKTAEKTEANTTAENNSTK